MSAGSSPRPSGAAETALAILLLAAAAALPFVHVLDAAVTPWVEGVRTCAGQRVFSVVSDWTRPVGFGLVLLVLARRVLRDRRARWRGMPTALGALLVGTFLIEVVKRAVDRPRPDASDLWHPGAAYPSGHVGNAVLCALVVVCLWRGAVGRGFGRGWLLVLATVLVVGTARVYTGRHWTTDVLGTAALMSGFGVLALAHPRPPVRVTTLVLTGVLVAVVFGATLRGWHVEIAGGVPLAEPPLATLDFTTVLARDRLRGTWRAEIPGDVQRGVWLWSPSGTLALDVPGGPVDAVRVVLWPRPVARRGACSRLRVALNGVPLGERLLHGGWRGYAFPVAGHWHAGGENVLELSVVPIGRDARGTAPPFAAFREVTVHAPFRRGS